MIPRQRILRSYHTNLDWTMAKRVTERILDGTSISAQIKAELKAEVTQLGQQGIRPGLAAVLVGENPASQVYVRSKVRTCEQLGLFSEMITPPASISTEELLAIVDELNHREDIDGILVQLPLPSQIDSKRILLAVDPAKDVDGFHPFNIGLLSSCARVWCLARHPAAWKFSAEAVSKWPARMRSWLAEATLSASPWQCC